MLLNLLLILTSPNNLSYNKKVKEKTMNKSDKTDMQVIGKSNQNNNRNDEKLQKELLTTLQRDIRDYYTYLIISVVVAIFMLF